MTVLHIVQKQGREKIQKRLISNAMLNKENTDAEYLQDNSKILNIHSTNEWTALNQVIKLIKKSYRIIPRFEF